MILFRNLDSSGDWTFGNGKANYVSDVSAIGLDIKTALNSWLDDCFFDMAAGIDWKTRLGSRNQKTLLDNDCKRIILQREGVTGIAAFDSVLNDRAYTAHYTVNTIYGQQYKDSIARDF